MKRIVAILILICLLSPLLCACDGYEKGKTFSADFLQSVALRDMPKPNCEDYALNSLTEGTESLRMGMDLEDFEAYINSFIDYMSARDDIYYFGLQDSEGLLGEMIPHRVAKQVEGEFQWERGTYWYTFAYSLDSEVLEASACSEHKQHIDPIIVTFEYDDENGTAYVKISKNGTFASSCIDGMLHAQFQSNEELR